LKLLKYSFVHVIIEVDLEVHMTQSSELLTVKEVAEILRVSQPTVLRMIDDGELRAIRVRNQWRIRRSDLDDFLQRGGSSGRDRQ
jgi:excisionase family DNA binding protein